MEKRLIDASQTDEEGKKRETLYNNVKDGMVVVELGCGNSDLLSNLKAKYPNCEVYGLDFSKVVIEEMKDTFPDIEYEVGDALKTPYKDNYFDIVMAGELIEHIENPDDLAKEMVRICKKDGVISISTPFKETDWRIKIPPEHIWEFDRQDMIDIFSKYGKTEIKLFIGSKAHIVVNCQLNKTGVESPYTKYKKLRKEKKIIVNELVGKEFDNVLELGCQWGENLKAIQEVFPDKKLKGIDINKNVLDDARNFTKGIDLEYGDVNKLNVPDKSYDVVFTEALLCMLTAKDAEHAIKEILRIAKKYILLVELDDDTNKYGYIGLSGRLVVNYEEVFKELGYKIEKRKIKKREWNAEPWITYGYLITIKL